MMTPVMMIAIDGPAASGKSTLAERLAAQLHYLYLDTGVMYRAVTLAVLRRGVSVQDEAGVTELARQIDIDVRPPSVADKRQYDVLLDGKDVTWEIRAPEIDQHVSAVSAYAGVRQAMTIQQRQIARRGPVVMVGRDIGTVVIPEAELKIYLDASVEERARRRYLESLQRGGHTSYEQVLESMRERDRYDSSRQLAPLKPAEDAVILDTTNLSIDEVVESALKLLEKAGGPAVVSPSRGGSPLNEENISTQRLVQSLLPWHVRLARAVLRPLFRGLFHVLTRVKVEGLDNVPRTGGYLVSCNHVSIVDPALLLAFWPRPLEAAGAIEILERPFQGPLMRFYGGLSVHRGTADRELLEAMVTRLRAGLPTLMDPEGERSHAPGMQRGKPGAAYLAAKAGVPVVPVGITGTEDVDEILSLRRRPLLRMVIGKPLYLPAVPWRSPERKAVLQANTVLIMRAIANVLPAEYRGIYGS